MKSEVEWSFGDGEGKPRKVEPHADGRMKVSLSHRPKRDKYCRRG